MKKSVQTSVEQVINKNCVVYYRCSRSVQKDLRQEQDCINYCKTNGYTIIETFREKISGRKRDRQAMTDCINYLKNNNVHYLICSELSRIGRSLEASKILDELTQMRVCIITLKEEIKTFRDDFTVDNNQIVLANFAITNAIKESDYLSYRVKSGKKSAVLSSNVWTGGKYLAYGYASVDKQLCVDKKEAEIVKTIFNKYLDGWGSIKIANWLNMQNIPTKLNQRWQRSTINQMLPHKIYIGQRQYEDNIIEVPELRIIDDNTFNAVQKRMKERKNTDQTFNQLRKYDYLFDKGLIKCGHCGKNYYANIRKEKPNEGFYKCTSGKYHRGCGCESIKIDWLEQYVNQYLFKNLFKLLEDNTAMHAQTEKLKLELKLLEAEQIKEQSKQDRYNEMYALGRLNRTQYDKHYIASQDLLLKQKEQMNKIQEQIQANNQVKKTIVNQKYNYIGGKLNLQSTNISKDTLHKVIKRITVNKTNNKKQTIEVHLINEKKFHFEYDREQTKIDFTKVNKLPTIPIFETKD